MRWCINQFIEDIESYIKDNDAVWKFCKEQKAQEEALQLNANVTAEVKPAEAKTISSNENTSTSVGEAVDAAATDESSFKAATTWIKFSAAKLVAPNYFGLKADKVAEANNFIASVKSIYGDLATIDDPVQVKPKLMELKKLVDSEVDNIKLILEKHFNQNNYKPESGQYDAVLRVFQKIVDWMLEDKNYHLLSIQMRFYAPIPTAPTTNTTGNRGNTISVTHYAAKEVNTPNVEAKNAVDAFMEVILELQIDAAQSKEPKLNRQAKLAETESSIMQNYCASAIHSLSVFHDLHQAAGKTYVTDAPIRLQNAGDVIAGVCYKTAKLKAKLTNFLSSNAYVDDVLGRFETLQTRAANKYAEYEKRTNDNVIKKVTDKSKLNA